MGDAAFWAVVCARFVVPFAILRFPLPGIAASLILDAVDQTAIDTFRATPMSRYQSYDKTLDVFYLTIAYFAVLRNWRQRRITHWMRFLFLYRLIGVYLFELFEQRWILLAFANTFEYVFFAIAVVQARWDPSRISARGLTQLVTAIWVVKLPQEWWLHVAQRDLTDTLRDHQEAGWVLVFGVGVAAAAIRHGIRQLPPPRHPLTFDVDRLQSPPPPATRRDNFASAVLVEKTLVLAITIYLFASLLPEVETRGRPLVLAVVAVVAVNAVASQALRMLGRTWPNIVAEFATVASVNLSIVTVDAAIGTRRVSVLPAATTVFFVLLISVLVALFDRYRVQYGRRRRNVDRFRLALRHFAPPS